MDSLDDWVKFFEVAGITEASDVEKYASNFAKAEIQESVLEDLNHELLKTELGISCLGHRLIILRFIKNMKRKEENAILVTQTPNENVKKVQELSQKISNLEPRVRDLENAVNFFYCRQLIRSKMRSINTNLEEFGKVYNLFKSQSIEYI